MVNQCRLVRRELVVVNQCRLVRRELVWLTSVESVD